MILYPLFLLRSPYTISSSYAYYIELDGEVYGDYHGAYYSYGSPGTNMPSRTFHSDPIGDVWYDSAGAGGVASYGR